MLRSGVDIRLTQFGDAELLAAELRDQDRKELDAAGHRDHLAAVRESVQHSKWSLSAFDDTGIICIGGLAERGSVLTPVGVPWLLGTDRLLKHRRVLGRAAREYTAAMLRDYPRLFNAVHTHNEVSKKWLARIGFTLHAPVPHPVTGELFHPFEMSRHV